MAGRNPGRSIDWSVQALQYRTMTGFVDSIQSRTTPGPVRIQPTGACWLAGFSSRCSARTLPRDLHLQCPCRVTVFASQHVTNQFAYPGVSFRLRVGGCLLAREQFPRPTVNHDGVSLPRNSTAGVGQDGGSVTWSPS
jgi:hypothetical protein